jgi:hypothetical protein
MLNRRYISDIPVIYQLAAFIVAVNYFSFQVELFEDEYEKNNPLPSSVPTFTYSSVNWESFDKTNAPKAFVFIVPRDFILLCLNPPVLGEELPASLPFRVVHNNSPPSVSSDIS